jgi:hypothetical protein
MAYSNNWKIASGATVKLSSVNGGVAIEDCTMIGFPNEMRSLVEITTIGSSRKEFVMSDVADSDEITFTAPYLGVVNDGIVSKTLLTGCQIFLPKLNGGSGYTYTFSGFVTKCEVSNLELDGKIGWTISVKPTTALTRS